MSAPHSTPSGELVKRALALAAQGDLRGALPLARSARAGNPPAALLSNLGTLFTMCQCFDEALDAFARAVQLEPSNSTYLYNLSTAQRSVGDLSGAEASCESALRSNPHDAQALYLRSDLRQQTPESNHVEALERLLAEGVAAPQSKALISFALAKELEDLREYARSFAHLKVATSTYRSTLRYDVADDIKTIDAILRGHTSAALRAACPGHARAEPIFVVGLPRSGTTLVERIIQSHSNVVSVGERNDFALEMVRLTGNCSSREERVQRSIAIDMAALGRRYLERVTPENAGTRRIVDKTPINYLYCGLIHAALPRAKIVSVRRDPMDSCYAAYKAFLTGPYAFTYDLDELASYYLAYQRLVEHWHKTLPPSAYLEVQYESLVTDFEPQVRRLLEFLGLPWQGDVTRFFESPTASSTASAAQIRRPIYATSIGKWRNYEQQLAPLAKRLGVASA